MTWRESVAAALNRVAGGFMSRLITRRELIHHELPRIIHETRSTGKTPEQTLSRILQEIRDDGQIEFVGDGEYRPLVSKIR